MHVLTLEQGSVSYLHYGLFANPDESLAIAQERSTELLLARLPQPPARLLDVGTGLGTTLARLTSLGYDVLGITPDEKQIALLEPSLNARCIAFENLTNERFDAVIFQESSQYIDSQTLFAKAAKLTDHIIVLDEFTIANEGTLHRLADFLAAATTHGFRKTEELDLTAQAAPTITYVSALIAKHRNALKTDLEISDEQITDLIDSGTRYAESYRIGTYGYRLLQFEK
ncbi:MAG TPA: methyltransferase domain-containing protein [Thermoanaerobaculia bacterium]|nr:methyltransferase domain-containing protein [Thermoanaerobaculia bacterium]